MDTKIMTARKLLETYMSLYIVVEIEGRATYEDMRSYFLVKQELEHRGYQGFLGNPYYERSDAA